MRYPDGGGLTDEERVRRERVRLEAAQMFAAGVAVPVVARRLRVTPNTAYRWRRAWRDGGVAGLASRGPASRCRLTEAQLGALEAALDLGPAVYGWADQRWTLARVAALISEMFMVSYTLRGVSYLLHRLGWSPQVPRHRAAERNEAKIAAWRDEVWPQIKAPLGATARGSASKMSPASRCGRPRAAAGPAAGRPRS